MLLMRWLIVFAVLAFLFRRPLGALVSGLLREADSSPGARLVYETEVVGESKYQHNLGRLCGSRTPDGVEVFKDAVLVLEPENKHDENAVRVEIDGLLVGYLSRQEAIKWHRTRPPARHQCAAVIRGGWDRGGDDTGHFGVWLNLY